MSRARRPGVAGFTLVEVMISLAILSLGLVSLLVFTGNNVFQTQRSARENVAVELARGKMYDLEEDLLRDGFQELNVELGPETFEEEGWPDYSWEATIAKVEIDMNAMRALATAAAGQAGAQPGTPAPGTPGGPRSLLGAAAGQDAEAAMAAAASGGILEIFMPVLETAIRKITLKVTWSSAGSPQELAVSYYVTDPGAVDRSPLAALAGAGAGEEGGQEAGGGRTGETGTGRGRGSTRGGTP
jgi:prepilin-type N-terminal cleavage/methylation domain-containing protein